MSWPEFYYLELHIGILLPVDLFFHKYCLAFQYVLKVIDNDYEMHHLDLSV